MPLNPARPPVALPTESLKVGMVLPFTLMDGGGVVLLAKGQRIVDQSQLQALRDRRELFVPFDESAEAVKVWMAGFNAAERSDAALKDLDQFLELDTRKTAVPLQGTLNHQCDELALRLRRLLLGLAQGRLAGPEALDACSALYANFEQLLGKPVQAEAATLLLTYRACTSLADYSVVHALQCAVLAYRLVPALGLEASAARTLVLATATMNVAMVEAQDELARQKGAPSITQRQVIDQHAEAGARLLEQAGIQDADWLEAVRLHHASLPEGPLVESPLSQRLARIVHGVDRYTAAMSPRASRPGRTSQDAARAVIVRSSNQAQDPVGIALLQLLGLYPPGTFVLLKAGETGLVLRPGSNVRTPVLALVVNRAGEPIGSPKLADGRLPEYAPAVGVPGSNVKARINLDEMVKMLQYSRTPAAHLP